MKCFVHDQADAVAVCKHCGKALCRACAVDRPPGGVSCRGSCEEQTRLAWAQLHQGRATAAANRAMLALLGAGSAGLGVLVILIGQVLQGTMGVPVAFPLQLLSSLLFVLGLLTFVASRFYPKA
jgi:hypothetical protein